MIQWFFYFDFDHCIFVFDIRDEKKKQPKGCSYVITLCDNLRSKKYEGGVNYALSIYKKLSLLLACATFETKRSSEYLNALLFFHPHKKSEDT